MSSKKENKKTLYLIDGSSFLYRAFYALKPLTSIDGQPVQAVFGFCRMIKKLIKQFNPEYCVVAWDSKGKTARHEIYPDYKATREARPLDLISQKELIQKFAEMIGLHQISESGVEADDLMASLAQTCSKKGFDVVLITTDKDLAQVVDEHIFLYDPFKDTLYDREALQEKYGFSVEKLPFYFSLLGDSSDNIPGVKGIGKVGAKKLVCQFESLEDLYANLDKVESARTRSLLESSRNNAFLSLQLFLLRQVPVECISAQLAFDGRSFDNAVPFFRKYNFKSLISEAVKQKDGPYEPFAKRYGYVFKTITSEDDLKELCRLLKRKGVFAVDTETDSLRALESTLVGVSLCAEKGSSYYIPVAHATGERQLPKDVIFDHIQPILEDPSIKKYAHHAKFDRLVLANAGIELKGLVFDTLIAGGLVAQDGERLNLGFLSEKYLQEVMPSFKQVVTDRGLKTFAQVGLEVATDYSAADTHQTFALVEILQKELEKNKQEKLYKNIEFPLIDVLFEMERFGIFVDVDELADIGVRVDEKLSSLQESIADLVGASSVDINLNSPAQVSHLLFEQLKLEPVKKTTKKTGYSTSQEVLQELAKMHAVPKLILDYRELFKLKSTYIEGLPKYVNPYTGLIHTTYRQVGVATGRLSSNEPNLQNIPAGKQGQLIRKAFKATEGRAFISADYSQMELRVLAHLSGDEALISAFKKGEDIHARTAAGLFDVALADVKNKQRKAAKKINFSILYGLTPFGLSKALDIPLSDSKDYIDKYMEQYAGVRDWMEAVVRAAHDYGYVSTLFGRRRYVPGIYERNKVLYNLARRVAINTVVQGTAADIVKLAMVELQKTLRAVPEAHIVLQIHDELIVSVPTQSVALAEKVIQKTLQDVVSWNVPLDVAVRSGETWAEVSK